MAKEHDGFSFLDRGFGTAKGRDFLLAKVTDEKEPLSARLRCASALQRAGDVFRSTFADLSTNSWHVVGEADEGNSGYLTRIAKAALATGEHEELCRRLVGCLDRFGQGIVQNKPAPMMVDLRGALATLKELYDAKPSQSLQFAIEMATAYVPDAYEKLQSPCGTFVSIVLPADAAKYTKPERRSLIFEYEYTTIFLGRDALVQPSLVLVHQRTKKRYVLPMGVQVRGWSTGGGSNSVVLPKDLPPGRYHAFFQVSEGGNVISTGHYCIADL